MNARLKSVERLPSGGLGRRLVRVAWVLACGALAACPPAPDLPPVDAGPEDAGSTGVCVPSSVLDADCRPILAAACDAGQRVVLGSTGCAAVGVPSCGPGFQRDPTGYGCQPVSVTACDGGLRASPSGCQALGDCGALFPPPEAAVVVDDDGPEDATHTRTLAAALALIPDGGVIAIEEGVYEGGVTLVRPTRLVGRCPQRVVLRSPTVAGPGVAVMAPVRVEVSGLTLEGFERGVLADKGAQLTVRASRITKSRGLGFHARVGSSLALEEVAIEDTVPTQAGNYGWGGAIYGGAQVTAAGLSIARSVGYGILASDVGSAFSGSGVVVTATGLELTASDPEGAAVAAQQGATVTLAQSILADAERRGLRVSTGSIASLLRSVISGTRTDSGAGVTVVTGARATLNEVTLDDHRRHAIFVHGAGSEVIVNQGLVTRSGRDGAAAVFALDQGRLTLSSSALVDNASNALAVLRARGTMEEGLIRGVVATPPSVSVQAIRYGGGVDVMDGAVVEVRSVTIEDVTTLGLNVLRTGVARAEGLLVRRVRAEPSITQIGYGTGLWASAGGTLEVTRSSVTEVPGVGLFVFGEGSSAVLRELVVSSAVPDSRGLYGHGVVVRQGGLLSSVDSTFSFNSAVALAVSGSRAALVGGQLAANSVALYAEDGVSISQSDDLAPVPPNELRVSSSTAFLENLARVGSGVVPLPEGLAF